MNEEIKRKAEQLIDEMLLYMSNLNDINGATHCAILSTKNTIDALDQLKMEYIKRNYISPELIIVLHEQTEILTELESRI